MSACYPLPLHADEASLLLDEAIRRSVARAIETGEPLDVAAEAGRLAAVWPQAAGAAVADLLMRAGVEARINLILASPPSADRGPAPDGAAGRGGPSIAPTVMC